MPTRRAVEPGEDEESDEVDDDGCEKVKYPRGEDKKKRAVRIQLERLRRA